MKGDKHMTIYIAGDSTAANQTNVYVGWGQMLQVFFKPEVVVDNRAANGRSSKSFIEEKRLDKISMAIQPNDYLLIQFGHNDQKPDERGTQPFTTYPETLKKYIDAAREKGALPVLITSVHRRKFDENGVQQDTHGDYSEAVRRLAAVEQIPLIDLHKRSGELLAELGVEKSIALFTHVAPGVYEKFPNGIKDDTHFSEYGATEMAKLVVSEIRANVPQLAKNLQN